jgi:hypothetical protein
MAVHDVDVDEIAPPRSTAAMSRPSAAKSADRIDGATHYRLVRRHRLTSRKSVALATRNPPAGFCRTTVPLGRRVWLRAGNADAETARAQARQQRVAFRANHVGHDIGRGFFPAVDQQRHARRARLRRRILRHDRVAG